VEQDGHDDEGHRHDDREEDGSERLHGSSERDECRDTGGDSDGK